MLSKGEKRIASSIINNALVKIRCLPSYLFKSDKRYSRKLPNKKYSQLLNTASFTVEYNREYFCSFTVFYESNINVEQCKLRSIFAFRGPTDKLTFRNVLFELLQVKHKWK